MPAAIRPEFITSAEIGQRLGLGRTAVTKLLKSGRLPAIDVSTGTQRQNFRVLREDFEEFLKEAKVRKVKK